MKYNPFSFIVVLIIIICTETTAQSKVLDSIPENFKKKNLVAWCIVPFDAMNRTPEERVAMLNELGITRVAYDWREKHVVEFEEEILQYKKNHIEYFAFWNQHPRAFELFEKHGSHPQIWKMVQNPIGFPENEKIKIAADRLEYLAQKAKGLGSRLGLYNHGGWEGEPETLVAVCKELNKRGFENVGIVYNFHHAHSRIKDFAVNLELMMPYLLCLNLNGMAKPSEVDEKIHKNKILAIGEGIHEKEMIKIVLDSGYDGPIGILGHIETQDVAISLQNNIAGLEKILNENLTIRMK
jgi:hypothetical protein